MKLRVLLGLATTLALGACEQRAGQEQPAGRGDAASRSEAGTDEIGAYGAPADSGAGDPGRPSVTDRSGAGQQETAAAGGTISGRLASLRDDVLTVQGDRRSYEVRIDENTRILRNEQPLAREDLKAGVNVRTNYRILEGHLVATEIEITGDAQPAASDEPPAP